MDRSYSHFGQRAVAKFNLSDPAAAIGSQLSNTCGKACLLCSEGHLTQGIEQLRTAVKLAPASREAAANLEHAFQLARQPR